MEHFYLWPRLGQVLLTDNMRGPHLVISIVAWTWVKKIFFIVRVLTSWLGKALCHQIKMRFVRGLGNAKWLSWISHSLDWFKCYSLSQNSNGRFHRQSSRSQTNLYHGQNSFLGFNFSQAFFFFFKLSLSFPIQKLSPVSQTYFLWFLGGCLNFRQGGLCISRTS